MKYCVYQRVGNILFIRECEILCLSLKWEILCLSEWEILCLSWSGKYCVYQSGKYRVYHWSGKYRVYHGVGNIVFIRVGNIVFIIGVEWEILCIIGAEWEILCLSEGGKYCGKYCVYQDVTYIDEHSVYHPTMVVTLYWLLCQ